MYSTNTPLILQYLGYITLTDFVSSAGSLTWYHTDPKPSEQDILDNELGWSIKEAKSRVKLEGAKRIAALYPFIDAKSEEALALYDLVGDIYGLIIPAARNSITGTLLTFKNTYDAAKDALIDIDTMTDVTLVQNYDAVNTPNWP